MQDHAGDAGTVAGVKRYLLPFGNDPYLPSEAKSSFVGFLNQAKVPTAAYCGQCHNRIYQDWRESAFELVSDALVQEEWWIC